MVIFLCGEDSYRRDKKEKEIISAFVEKNADSALRHFDGEEDFLTDIHGFLSNCSLFGEKKMAIISGLSIGVGLEVVLKNYLQDQTVCILISGGKKEKSFSFLEKKPVIFQCFPKLKGEEILFFLKKEAEERKLNIDLPALKLIASETDDLWSAISEIEKLSLLGKSAVGISETEFLMNGSPAANIFEFISAVKFRRSGALSALTRLEFAHEDPAKIFNILASQMPFAASRMADLDIDVKSGKLDYEEALSLIALDAL